MKGNPPTKPGQRCRVIGGRQSANGEGASANEGRFVETMYLHAKRAGTLDNSFAVWHCKSLDGLPLTTYYGAGMECDFLAVWLEVEEDDEAPKSTTTEKEITA